MNLTAKDFPRVITRNSIIINHDGRQHIVRSDEASYELLLGAFRENDWDSVPDLLSPKVALHALSNGQLRVEGEQVYLSDEDGCEFQVSQSLNDNILLHLEQKLNLDPLIKFALNLQRNPSSRSVAQLFDWISNTNLTITEDGCFLAYKGVQDNFKDSHSGTFDNSPGAVVKVRRNSVDDDPSRTCSHGLHVATHDYASTFSNKLMLVKVNPEHVVAVPTDYHRTKMRVCEYEVIEELENKVDHTHGLVYSSPASVSDDECCDCCGGDCDDDDHCDYCDYCGGHYHDDDCDCD